MLLTCRIQSVAPGEDGAPCPADVTLRPGLLDAGTGAIGFISCRESAAPDSDRGVTRIRVLIGNREFDLEFDERRHCVTERCLAQHHEEFLALFGAQQVLGISGERTFH